MYLTLKVGLELTDKQKDILNQGFGIYRKTWNTMLDRHNYTYNKNSIKHLAYQGNKLINDIKIEEKEKKQDINKINDLKQQLEDNTETVINLFHGCEEPYSPYPSRNNFQKQYLSIQNQYEYFRFYNVFEDGKEKKVKSTNQPYRYACMLLAQAFDRAIKAGAGFPKYKNRFQKQTMHFFKDASISNNNLKDGKLNLTKAIKGLKIKTSKKYRIILSEHRENIKNITISRDKAGFYTASILIVDDTVTEGVNDNQGIIGIDHGFKDMIVASDGFKYNLRDLDKEYRKLYRIQRVHSRTVKGSKNREKVRLRLARQYRKIRCMVLDDIHKVTKHLCTSYKYIVIETLDIKGMMQNPCVAKMAQKIPLAEVIRQLLYKAPLYGCEIIQVSKWFPSSKMCSSCGYLYNLKYQREWICPACGKNHDRDFNASLNLEAEGLNILSQRNISAPSGGRSKACSYDIQNIRTSCDRKIPYSGF